MTPPVRSPQWLTVKEFARLMGRPERHVRRWVQNGTLTEFGISSYTISRGRFHNKHFICADYDLTP